MKKKNKLYSASSTLGYERKDNSGRMARIPLGYFSLIGNLTFDASTRPGRSPKKAYTSASEDVHLVHTAMFSIPLF